MARRDFEEFVSDIPGADQLLRKAADFENFRKRMFREELNPAVRGDGEARSSDDLR